MGKKINKVVVFGGSGFLGSHICDVLSERGYHVTIFDKVKSPFMKKNQEMVVGDILDEKLVNNIIKGNDYVYNFAGIADLDDAMARPLETIRQNILGNIILLQYSHKYRCKRFVYASTIYVYSSVGSFYRCSKQAAELYIEEFQKKYGLSFTILRYGTLYGPRSNEKNTIFKYIYEALKTSKITCHASGDEIREYIHVKDAALLSVDILKDEYINQHIIITGHNPMKLRQMLETIKEIYENKINIEFRPKESTAHYNITPYSFIPKIGKKLVSHKYLDIGQGLLETMNYIFHTINFKED